MDALPNRYVRGFDLPHTLYELFWDEGESRGAPGVNYTPKFLLRETNVFVGRENYLHIIMEWFKSDQPMLLLHGQGGVGKTRLAAQAVLEAYNYFEERIYGIPLDYEFGNNAEQVTPLQFAVRIAMAVEAPEDVINSDNPALLINYLQRRFATKSFLPSACPR